MIEQFVIYSKPRDFPVGFVVRRWTITLDGPVAQEAWVSQTLEGAREFVPPGLYRLGRHPSDEPQIVEVWI